MNTLIRLQRLLLYKVLSSMQVCIRFYYRISSQKKERKHTPCSVSQQIHRTDVHSGQLQLVMSATLSSLVHHVSDYAAAVQPNKSVYNVCFDERARHMMKDGWSKCTTTKLYIGGKNESWIKWCMNMSVVLKVSQEEGILTKKVDQYLFGKL